MISLSNTERAAQRIETENSKRVVTANAPRLVLEDNLADKAIFWAFVAGLAWVPFWFGSNTLTAWGINAAVFPALTLIYEISLLIRQRRHPVAVKQIAISAMLFSAVVVWIIVQNATWTPPTVHNQIWSMAADALARPVNSSITVDRDLTTQALVRLVTAASVFWLALQLGRDSVRANQLIAAIAAICAAYATYGLIAFAVTPGYVLWFEDSNIRGFVSSTFFNRNNFATYSGMGLVLICGLLMRLYRNESTIAGPRRLRIAALIDTTGRAGALHICAGFVVLVAVLLTGSRGGIISTAFGIFVLVALTFGRSKKSTVDQRDIIILVAFIIAAIFLALGDTLIGKISQQGLNDESRMAIYMITLGSILDSPILGYGYGTFADVFPIFRDRSVDITGVWEMAHNTYLELFQGLGVIFGLMFLVSVGLLVVRTVKGATTRKINATIAGIAAGVSCLIAVNALVDFSLQIQAVTLTFMAILGVGVAQSESSRLNLQD
jgi:O-antigen ligase